MDLINKEDLTNNLTHSEKIKRRKALDELNKQLFNNEKFSSQDLLSILCLFEGLLISRLSDESEINRSKACKLLQYFLVKEVKTKSFVSFVIPSLYNRIGKIPLVEESEENRLDFITLIENMLDIYGNEMETYINDLCIIFTNCLLDNYPEVIIKTCDCIGKLKKVIGAKFQMFSNSFIKPLLKSLSKHRMKVRMKCINTIECICVYGDIQNFEDLNNTLKLYILDIPQIRLALLSYGFKLSTEMRDRYSFWHLILPFVLFGLRNEDREIQELSALYWQKIGTKYEAENEDIRKQFEVNLTGREFNVNIPLKFDYGAGCCILIEKSFHRMLDSITSSIEDWQVGVRLEGMRLHTVCVMGLRDSNLQYSNKIISNLNFAVHDQDLRVVSECLFCSECLGLFLPPELYIPLMQPFISERTEESMRILSSLVKNTPNQRLQNSLSYFIPILSFSNFKDGIPVNTQYELLMIMEKIFGACKFDQFQVDTLFTLIYIIEFAIGSLDEELQISSLNVFNLAAKSYDLESCDELVSRNLESCLKKLQETSPWVEESDPELFVFLFISSSKEFGNHLETIKSVLVEKLPMETNPLVVFRIHETLKIVMGRIHESGNSDLLQKWIIYLLRDHVSKMLSHYSRLTGESFRLALLSLLNSILKLSHEGNAEIYKAMDPCLKFLPGLSRERLIESRALACTFIELLTEKFVNFIDDDSFFEYIQLLCDRLNDDNEDVRRASLGSLRCCINRFPNFDRNSTKIMSLMDSLAEFLHEEDDRFQERILELLKYLGKYNNDHLQSLIQDSDCEGNLTRRLEQIDVNS